MVLVRQYFGARERKVTSTVTCCLPSHLAYPRPLMSTGTTPDPEIMVAEWDRDVRKGMNDFKADDSTILIKIAADEKDTVYRVSTPLQARPTLNMSL